MKKRLWVKDRDFQVEDRHRGGRPKAFKEEELENSINEFGRSSTSKETSSRQNN